MHHWWSLWGYGYESQRCFLTTSHSSYIKHQLRREWSCDIFRSQLLTRSKSHSNDQDNWFIKQGVNQNQESWCDSVMFGRVPDWELPILLSTDCDLSDQTVDQALRYKTRISRRDLQIYLLNHFQIPQILVWQSILRQISDRWLYWDKFHRWKQRRDDAKQSDWSSGILFEQMLELIRAARWRCCLSKILTTCVSVQVLLLWFLWIEATSAVRNWDDSLWHANVGRVPTFKIWGNLIKIKTISN